MSQITSALDLKQYALRELGKPVINIEVDNIQIDDRIQDTVDEFLEYHIDGYEEAPLLYEIRKSDYDKNSLTLPSNVIGVHEILMSGSDGSSLQAINDYQYQIYRDLYWSVWSTGTSNTKGFDLVNLYNFREYMATMDLMLTPDPWYSFNTVTKELKTNSDLVVYPITYEVANYSESPNYIEIEGDIRNQAKPDRETEIEGELYTISKVELDDSVSPSLTRIYFNNTLSISPIPSPFEVTIYRGNVVALVTHAEIDENTPSIYSQLWVREMTKARIKYQWASNLRKFKNIKLPGNVEFNADDLLKEAKEEIKELKEELHTRYQEPPDFFVG